MVFSTQILRSAEGHSATGPDKRPPTGYDGGNFYALYEKCLRDAHAALKTGSECSFTVSKLRFLACFRLA
ncbi:hypothetical protein [Pseudomonas sp. CC120222-01a]|uniref:hypothetical protein n=1 Tax=Pseudomonas sp. CC120222-01a TaxID=1378075 RepID=UPI0010580691|nr:hypothetical protein [Pseudomonas sp. CC120222-01a]